MKFTQLILEVLRGDLKRDKNQKINFSSLKRFGPYIRDYWKKFALGSFLLICVSLLALPTPYIMKLIIDDIISEKNIKLLNLLIILLLAIQFIKLLISFFTSYFFDLFNQEIIVQIKKDLFYSILKLPLSFFDKNQTGYLLSRITEVEGLRFFFSSSLIRLIIGFLELIFSIGILFYLNVKLTLISLLILPFFYITTKFYSKGIRKVSREVMEKGAVLSKHIQDSLTGVDVVKIFSAEERETSKIHFHLEDLKKSDIKQNVIASFSSELLSLLGITGGLLVLWFGGLNIISGTFTVGGYVAFTGYLAKLYGPTQSFAMMGLSVQPALASLKRIDEIFSMTGEVECRELKKESPGPIEKIEFQNVTFSYDQNRIAVKNISFSMHKAEKVLLLGPNGSGKSTIAKLLLGLYKTVAGNIRINNQDVDEIPLSLLRERVSVVSQNVFLFNDTIKNNILFSKPSAKIQEVERAARLSGSMDFINGFDEAMDTIVGESGRKISGGEKQKISIARAILKDADVIIFDEATSQQDSNSVGTIEKLIEQEFFNKICLIISHRPVEILNLDKIVRLNKGKISEIVSSRVSLQDSQKSFRK